MGEILWNHGQWYLHVQKRDIRVFKKKVAAAGNALGPTTHVVQASPVAEKEVKEVEHISTQTCLNDLARAWSLWQLAYESRGLRPPHFPQRSPVDWDAQSQQMW